MLSEMKSLTKTCLRSVGVEVSRYQPPRSKIKKTGAVNGRYRHNLLYEADPVFQELYSKGMTISGTPKTRQRPLRFYNLVQFLTQTLPLQGHYVECGCWKGLSSYIMCNYIKRYDPSFAGNQYFVVDSFEGLSEPTEFDKITDLAVAGEEKETGFPAGGFAASLEEVKGNLSDFPNIEYFKGWIPPVLDGLPEVTYKFVHIDVDIYEPIHGSIQYFYPRLVPGGLIIFDDYGSLKWPGAKKAVDEYCEANNIPLLRLATGQSVVWKHPNISSQYID